MDNEYQIVEIPIPCKIAHKIEKVISEVFFCIVCGLALFVDGCLGAIGIQMILNPYYMVNVIIASNSVVSIQYKIIGVEGMGICIIMLFVFATSLIFPTCKVKFTCKKEKA
jgi:hypothetical protein